jgi:hypothetical protein
MMLYEGAMYRCAIVQDLSPANSRFKTIPWKVQKLIIAWNIMELIYEGF